MHMATHEPWLSLSHGVHEFDFKILGQFFSMLATPSNGSAKGSVRRIGLGRKQSTFSQEQNGSKSRNDVSKTNGRITKFPSLVKQFPLSVKTNTAGPGLDFRSCGAIRFGHRFGG